MKYFASILFCLACFFSANAQEKRIVATASMIQDMAQNIVGDLHKVESIVPIGGDPHIYEPTPADAKQIADADLILKNGLTFEGWLNELIENSGTEAEVVTVTDGISPIASETYQNATDPHAWMDASLALTYVENIYQAVSALDPENKDIYQFNRDAYQDQLRDLDAYIFEEIGKIPEHKRILITSHDAFQYYGRRYGIQLESVLGVSTDADVQTSDIIRLNNIIRERQVPAVFIESTINPKLLEQLAQDNEIRIGGKLFSDSLGEEGGPASTYLKMLTHNTQTIVKALTQSPEESNEDQTAGENTSDSWWLFGVIAVLLLGGFLYVVFKLNRS